MNCWRYCRNETWLRFFFDADPLRSFNTPEDCDLPVDPDGEEILNRFLAAWKTGPLSDLFHLSTEAALRNFHWNPRPGVEELAMRSRQNDFGVFVGYTGTLLGAYGEKSIGEELLPILENLSRSLGGGPIRRGEIP